MASCLNYLKIKIVQKNSANIYVHTCVYRYVENIYKYIGTIINVCMYIWISVAYIPTTCLSH